jgi:hypothetical protein
MAAVVSGSLKPNIIHQIPFQRQTFSLSQALHDGV